jgi:hypothetical protein
LKDTKNRNKKAYVDPRWMGELEKIRSFKKKGLKLWYSETMGDLTYTHGGSYKYDPGFHYYHVSPYSIEYRKFLCPAGVGATPVEAVKDWWKKNIKNHHDRIFVASVETTGRWNDPVKTAVYKTFRYINGNWRMADPIKLTEHK